MLKNVIVACGGGIATSTIIADKIRNFLNDENIANNVWQTTLSELYSEANKADLIVTTMSVETDYGVPLVQGTSLLTGLEEEKTKKEIVEILS